MQDETYTTYDGVLHVGYVHSDGHELIAIYNARSMTDMLLWRRVGTRQTTYILDKYVGHMPTIPEDRIMIAEIMNSGQVRRLSVYEDRIR